MEPPLCLITKNLGFYASETYLLKVQIMGIVLDG